MVVTRQPLKLESAIFSAAAISLVLHCLVAALLLFCLKESRVMTLQQNIISVDIRTLEPEKEEIARVISPAPAKAEGKLISRPILPARDVQQPVQKAEAFQEPAPLSAPSRATPAEIPPVAQPQQGRIESMVRPLSFTIPGVNPSRAVTAPLAAKGTPSAIVGPVDVKKEQAYLAALKEMIERNKEYPLLARKGGMEGTVRIRCTLSRNGELRDAAVSKASGYAILDNAALRAVRSAGRFPGVPTEIMGETFSFVAPINFRLAAE